MKPYYNPPLENYDRIVHVVNYPYIVDYSLKELCEKFSEQVTTPFGVVPKYHLQGTELWAWGTQGSCKYLVQVFDTLRDAEEELYSIYLYELQSSIKSPFWFESFEEAFEELEDIEQHNHTTLTTHT